MSATLTQETTRRRRTPAKKTEDEKTQTELRDELFANGSEFKPTHRDEIVGIDNVLGEIEEIIHWLRHSREYAKYNSRLQPGVIFEGHPGTGKTLVSRWIATESNALFINVRDFAHKGSLFTDTDIRDLFRRARRAYNADQKPVILFWDEFENAAIERGSGDATPDQKSVVSELTAQLDGVHGKNQGILLVGCTNYITYIDAALRRKGRMGLHIEFHAPDRAGKQKILAHYLSDMVCEHGIDTDTLSYFFSKNATAADIEEACVEAWRHAVRRSIINGGEPSVANPDLVQVFIKNLVGPPTTYTVPEEERMSIAIHEVGHALCALAYDVPLRLITVQPGKKSLGRVMVDDRQEYVGTIKSELNYLRMTLGGLAAERASGIDEMVGSTSDIGRVNERAAYLVDQLAAGRNTGVLNVTAFQRQIGYSTMSPQVSPGLLSNSDTDIKELVEAAERDAVNLLKNIGEKALWMIASIVNDRVTMTGGEFTDVAQDVLGYHPREARLGDQ